ncbi:unnamed protein product, partial [Coregonus sp. 'balchen']
MACKTVENVCTMVSHYAQGFITGEMGPMLWYLFTHSTVDSLRVSAISALCRITRLSASAFQSVIDKVGLPAILASLVSGISRVQQHILTMFAAMLAMVMYIERDIRKATPGKELQSSNEYLSKCLDLLIRHVVLELPAILDDMLSVLGSIVGRKHPSTVQAKQLKQSVPMMTVNHITSIDASETSLGSAIGQAGSEELIRNTLSAVEAISQHPALLTPHHCTVVDCILPPLTSLAFSKN